MVKRALDSILATFGLAVTAPVLLCACLFVWLQDFRSPLYVAPRVGRGGKPFRMIKLRSMVVNADRSGVDSTAASDARITPIGKIVRAWKLDELSQLWNVIRGDMSLVGPRPNVANETARYTAEEQRLLDVRPGLTDFASIVFSDEGEILRNSVDPDLDYNRLIRPWKSQLALIYVDNRSLQVDLYLICATVLAATSKPAALRFLALLLKRLGASEDVCSVARRQPPLFPTAPPGADRPVIAADLYGSHAVA